MREIIFTLPLCPSVNDYYGDKVIFVKKFGKQIPIVSKYVKKEGKEYKKMVENFKKDNNIPELKAPYHLEVSVNLKDKKRRDLDNLMKCLQDSLTGSKIIEDDTFIHNMNIFKVLDRSIDENYFVITIREVKDEYEFDQLFKR